MVNRLYRLALVLGLSSLATAELRAIDPLRIRDLGQEREFLVSEREVLVVNRRATEVGGLRRRVESGVPGAVVLQDTETRALVRLSAPIDEVASANRTDALSRALPDVEVLPVVYAAGTLESEATRRYVTKEIVVSLPENQTIQQLAASVAATASRPTIRPELFILTFPTPYQTFEAIRKLRARDLYAEPLVQHVMAKKAIELPKDQFFSSQWHLVNTGQDNGVPGIDANVLGAWQVTKGAGITLAIVDDCVQTLHPDLTAGCPPLSSNFHFDFNDQDNDPRPGISDAHGTACAGVAAARQNNGSFDLNTGLQLGVSGAAPETRILGLRLISSGFSDEDSALALSWSPEGALVDVSSNSWGPPDGAFGLAGPDILTKEALKKAATEGRNGLGQVTVFAAGNGNFYTDDSNADGFANSRYVLAVSAIGHRGTQAVYSEPGANILVGAPSQGDFASIAITTTDVTGTGGYNPANKNPSNVLNLPNTDYTNTFNGTSSACPLVAGCVSLILGANPLLGWRDVKEIVATTATLIDAADFGWEADPLNPFNYIYNGAGFHFNHKYGAGMINATAAVARAQTWTKLGAEVKQSRTLTGGIGGVVPVAIPDAPGGPIIRDFDFSGDPNLRLEQIEVIIDITHPHRSDLQISIISPVGTRSVLASPKAKPSLGSLDTDADFKDYTLNFENIRNVKRPEGWTFTTTHHWGENSNGTANIFGRGRWRLEIVDTKTNSVGTLNSATVNLYGTLGANNTPAPEARFAIARDYYSPSESGGALQLDVVRLERNVGEAWVDYVIVPATATPGDDYQQTTGTLHFADGADLADTPITVNIVQDALPERTETFYVMLKNPVNGSLGGGVATVDIFDDELNEVTVVATDPEATETDGGLATDTGTFTISRQTALSTPLTVKFELTGAAVLGISATSDYTIDTIPAGSLSVTIPPLETSATVTVIPRNDTTMEGTEEVILRVLPDIAYTPSIADRATVLIRDNDLPQIQLVATDDFAAENPTATASCRIQRFDTTGQPLPSDQALTVFLTLGGTQIPPGQLGANYTITANGNPVTNSVQIPAGSDHVDLTITPLNDDVYQPTKTIVIGIEVNPNYTFSFGFLSSAKINVVEDDPVPESSAPIVSIEQPNTKSITSPATVTASGSAGDNLSVKRVLYRVNNGAWKIATFNPAPNGTWSADVTADLVLGTNRLDAQAIDDAGNLSKIAVRQFEYVAFRDLNVTVTGTGAVSKDFAGVTSRQVGRTFSVTAIPAQGFVFNGWTGLVTSNQPTISFLMPAVAASLTANFVPTPFVEQIAGNYTGLVRGATFNNESSGYLTLSLAPTGAASGRLTMGGIAYGFKGAFTGSGLLQMTIPRKNGLPFVCNLQCDLNVAGTRRVTGTIVSGAFTSNVTADRTFYGKQNPAPASLVKTYTMVLPPAVPTADLQRDPRGMGYATMTIDASGMVKWKGVLGDGTKVNQTQPLTKDNTWPLYVSLYKKRGVILGPVALDLLAATTDFTGTVSWIKPTNSKDQFFPLGFKIENGVVQGSIFAAKPEGTRVLSGFADVADNGRITLAEGNLASPIVRKVTFGADNGVAISNPGLDGLQVKIAGKTGALTGSFVHPSSGKTVKIDGVVLQKMQKAFGFFPGSLPQKEANPQTGRLTFEPAP